MTVKLKFAKYVIKCRTTILILKLCYVFTFSSLISFPASIALASFGDPISQLDPTMFKILTDIGDHRLASAKADHDKALKKAAREGGTPPPPLPLQVRVPAAFRRSLRYAYASIYLLDEQALTLSYFNQTSPHLYPDQEQHSKALLMMPSPILIEQEIDRASSQFAVARGRYLQLI